MNDKIINVALTVCHEYARYFIHIYINKAWFKCVHILFIFCVNYSHGYEFICIHCHKYSLKCRCYLQVRDQKMSGNRDNK